MELLNRSLLDFMTKVPKNFIDYRNRSMISIATFEFRIRFIPIFLIRRGIINPSIGRLILYDPYLISVEHSHQDFFFYHILTVLDILLISMTILITTHSVLPTIETLLNTTDVLYSTGDDHFVAVIYQYVE